MPIMFAAVGSWFEAAELGEYAHSRLFVRLIPARPATNARHEHQQLAVPQLARPA